MNELELRDQDLLEQAADLAETSPQFVLPWSGEVISLLDAGQVADALDQVRDTKRRLDEIRSLFESLLRIRSRELGTKTLHLGDLDAVVSGGSRPEWDIELLERDLRAAGLPEERLDQLITATITYKVDNTIARQLRGANPAYAAALDAARTDVPAPWRVSVKHRY